MMKDKVSICFNFFCFSFRW